MKNIKIIEKTKALIFSALLFFGFLPVDAQTAHVVGGSNLINQAKANQFAVWLNEGHIRLTKIFSKTDGDGKDGEDFHAAADGQGRTVTFMRVDTHPTEYLIGGYNPQSWTSFNDFHLTPNNADRKAFIFNLTSNFIQRQKLQFTLCIEMDPGLFQTYDYEEWGPTFGRGFDIWIDDTLESGSVWHYSYGTGCHSNHILNINYPLQQNIDYDAFEVFKVTSTPTAATVSVGGRIQSANGTGLSKVVVSLVDANGNTRMALTSAFGYYRFDEIPVGVLAISVAAKRYNFASPTQVITALDNVANLDFTALE